MKVGIIGCGKITEVRHAPEYHENPHCEIAGFYDVVPEKAQALTDAIAGRYPAAEVVAVNGGQPVYYYIVSVE